MKLLYQFANTFSSTGRTSFLDVNWVTNDLGGFRSKIRCVAEKQDCSISPRRNSGIARTSSIRQRASGTERGTRKLQQAEQPWRQGMLCPLRRVLSATILVIFVETLRANGIISTNFTWLSVILTQKGTCSPRISSLKLIVPMQLPRLCTPLCLPGAVMGRFLLW